MNEKIKKYLKTLKYNEVLFDYLQMQENGIEELINNTKTGKMDAEEKRYFALNYFIYKFLEHSKIINKEILHGIDSFFYKNTKIFYKSNIDLNDIEINDIILDTNRLLTLIFV